MRKSDLPEEFTNISDEEEDEIHIIQQPKDVKPPSKRKKEQSIFRPLPEMDNLQLSLIGYQKESFLKIETQIYKLEIRNTQTDSMWLIKRRYSQVLWLHEVSIKLAQALSINHIGYIIPFFPNKTLESFFTAKVLHSVIQINIGMNKERKEDFLEERTEVISDFLRKIYGHPELKYSEEAKAFLTRVDSEFQAEKKKIESFSEEYRELETSSSNFLGLIERGTSLLSSYMGTKKLAREITAEDNEFGHYQQKAIEEGNKCKLLEKNINDLAMLKRQEAEAMPLEGDHDKLEIINTKLHMSKQPNLRLAESIFGMVHRPLNRLCYWAQQVTAQLEHRRSLVEFLFSLKQNIDDIGRIRKLERRIQKFENNFRKTWPGFLKEFQTELSGVLATYEKIWAEYSQLMAKIWK